MELAWRIAEPRWPPVNHASSRLTAFSPLQSTWINSAQNFPKQTVTIAIASQPSWQPWISRRVGIRMCRAVRSNSLWHWQMIREKLFEGQFFSLRHFSDSPERREGTFLKLEKEVVWWCVGLLFVGVAFFSLYSRRQLERDFSFVARQYTKSWDVMVGCWKCILDRLLKIHRRKISWWLIGFLMMPRRDEGVYEEKSSRIK